LSLDLKKEEGRKRKTLVEKRWFFTKGPVIMLAVFSALHHKSGPNKSQLLFKPLVL
jgi:hypothetical protein